MIHLMRHGQVENPNYIRYGRIPGYRLSALGRDQARQAADHLRTLAEPVTQIVSSPLERTVETATIVQQALGLPAITTDERLIEALNAFDGLHKLAFLSPRNWRELRDPFLPSWGEPFRAIARRMHAAIAEHRARPGVVLLVSHQSPIWIARHSYSSQLPPWTSQVRCSPASVTTLRFERGRYIGDRYWAPPSANPTHQAPVR
jgi:broad specificity phosphatase PhoE